MQMDRSPTPLVLCQQADHTGHTMKIQGEAAYQQVSETAEAE
jgi:hypothetical protein